MNVQSVLWKAILIKFVSLYIYTILSCGVRGVQRELKYTVHVQVKLNVNVVATYMYSYSCNASSFICLNLKEVTHLQCLALILWRVNESMWSCTNSAQTMLMHLLFRESWMGTYINKDEAKKLKLPIILFCNS